MNKITTYFVKRNGVYIWLSQNEKLLPTDIVIEKRVLWVAEDGKTLIDENGNVVGTCVWNKDNKELKEIDIPIEEEIVEETEGEIEDEQH